VQESVVVEYNLVLLLVALAFKRINKAGETCAYVLHFDRQVERLAVLNVAEVSLSVYASTRRLLTL